MSCSRRCDIFKATDNQWYMILGNSEYAEELMDCTTYGAFASEEKTLEYLDNNHSNPGGYSTDNSGTRPPPKEFVKPRSGSRHSIRW